MERDDLARALRGCGIDTASLRQLHLTDVGPIFGLTVSDTDEVDDGHDSDNSDVRPQLWRAVHELVDQTGYWPVLTQDHRNGAGRHWFAQRRVGQRRSTASIIEASLGIDAATWLADNFAAITTDEHFADEYRGTWPEYADPDDPEGQVDIYQALPAVDLFTLWQPSEVCLALVPATTSWDVPAVLQYEPVNSLRPPELHSAVLRRWHDLSSAQLLGMLPDTLELYVPNPPYDQEATRALAREHFAYCPDRLYQEVGTLEQLAGMLYCRPAWRFWWD